MKERILARFNKSNYLEYAKIDDDIVDLLKEINSYENVMTLHSCAGHPYVNSDGSNNVSEPYIAFVVNEKGWNTFWLECAPLIATDIIIDIEEYNDPLFGKISSKVFKFYIHVNSYFDLNNNTDYAHIIIYGCEGEEANKIFWDMIKNSFKKLS